MRFIAATVVCLSLVFATVALAADAPQKIVFESKMGNVTFDHTKHVERAKNDCATCHPKLFPQSRAPINYKAAMHRTAETAKTSCAGCHHAGGMSFETKGNCAKCHVK